MLIKFIDSPLANNNLIDEHELAMKLLPSLKAKVANQKTLKLGNLVILIVVLDDHAHTDDDSIANDKIVKDMMRDIKQLEQFRLQQKVSYMSRENPQVNFELLHETFNPENKEQKLESLKEAYLNHQKSYVELCKKFKTLPLPLLKKVRFETFILDNYQINTRIAKAFGETIYLLGSHLRKMKLLKNNLRDTEL